MTRLPGWLWGLIIVGIFAFAGWVGYSLGAPSQISDNDGTIEVTQDAPTRTTHTGDDDDERRTAPPPEPELRRPETSEPREIELSYLGWDTVDTDPENPRVCLTMSAAPDADRVVDDKSFVRITPDTPFSLAVDGRSLCVLGLDTNKSYSIDLLAGFTAENGRSLPTTVTAQVTFDPKPGLVGFVGEGIILPRGNDATLGIRAMNVTGATLTVYRVNHRALFDEAPDGGRTVLQGDWGYFNEAYSSRVKVHSEAMELAGQTNEMVETAFSLTDIVEANGPGAYIVYLSSNNVDNNGRDPMSYRWLYVTDLALASYRTEEALHVTLRSIETAKTVREAKVVLIARNNDVLAEAQTDAQGRAVIPAAAMRGQGNDAPKMLLAYAGDDDFAALDLTRSPLDLTAFDVAGRDASGAYDAFLYAERGIYRPGATVNLTALVRDVTGRAAFDRPGTLRILKPDATVLEDITVTPDGMAGALYRAIDIPDNAPRGRWTAELSLDGLDAPIGRLSFSVEDFAPEQLRLDVRVDDTPLRLGETRDVAIVADFLYGAPGRGLDAEAEARIQVDPKPFPDFANYSFGDPKTDFREQLIPFGSGVTDDEGQLETELELGGDAFRSSSPLRAFVTAGVAEPGGRYVRDSVFVPIRSADVYVGFDPKFEGGYARRNTPAAFDIVALDAAGERIAVEGKIRMIREDFDYQWFRENGRWRYRIDIRDQGIWERTAKIAANAPFRLTESLDYGQYRIEVEVDGVVSGFRFGSGWARSENNEAPDKMALGVGSDSFTPGDTIALTLDAPFAGMGELVLADSTVRRVVNVALEEGSQTVRVKTPRDWNADLYAMLTLYKPGENTVRATRSVGLVHIPVDRSRQRLEVSLSAPDKILPRQTQDVTIRVADAGRSEIFATLAAVDTGILQITDYSPPDPERILFGKRAFAVDVYDDYARMLAPYLGPDRVGGDSLGGAGLSVVPIQIVSLFEGPVQLKNGEAVVPIDVPDFQGELTLMTVVWSDEALGSASQPMIVRDPVTVQLSLPRFLAPGDTAVATLALDNVDGRDGTYASSVALSGRSIASASTPLKRGERAEEVIEITSADTGVQTYSLASQGPDFKVSREYRIETRAPGMPQTVSRTVQLGAGESLNVEQDAELADFVTGSTELRVSASYSPLFDPAPLMAALSRYPYGCSEQVTSVAMPLLVSRSIGRLSGQSDAQRSAAIEGSVERLLSRQSADGSIGLWREGDGNASPYVHLYASEFLLLADAEGFDLPRAARQRVINSLQTLAKLEKRSSLDLDYNYGMRGDRPNYELRAAERAATAMHLLAIHDTVAKTDVVYLQDRFGDKMESSISLTRLGAALEAIGESARANRAYTRAAERMDENEPTNYYVRGLVNVAALLSLPERLPPNVLQEVMLALPNAAPRYSNTHERSWLLRAAAATGSANVEVPFKGEAGWTAAGRTSALVVTQDRIIENSSDKPVYLTVSATGLPTAPQVAASNGASLTKTLHRMDGKVVSAPSIARGERAIIVVEAKTRSARDAMWVLADLLPAGFEIETVLSKDDAEENGAFAWVGNITDVDMSEARDDRFIASWRTQGRGRSTVRAAYIVRAVTQGEFAFPGAYLEDMYRPERNAATDASRLSITPDGTL